MRDTTRSPAWDAESLDTSGPGRQEMLRDVADGLGRRPQKTLSPKYFYDTRGSALFDEITRLPEYYLTRRERKLLGSFAGQWLASVGPCVLIELGPGSAEKTRTLLDALREGAWYVPVDISPSYLDQIATDVGADYPHLKVVPAEADISRDVRLPERLPHPAVFAFLGSTIGNFDRPTAVRLLQRVRDSMAGSDRMLLGADLRKDRRVIEAAYNDSRGITAAFNLNILHVLNRELDADFDTAAFEHRAFYNEAESRIEMHLVARAPQVIHIPGMDPVRIESGESIRTEISCKYDRPTLEAMFADAGLALEHWVTDDGTYALATARPEP